MRNLTTLIGSAFCALAVLAAPLNAKDKPNGAPAKDKPASSECRCKPDSCKCEKKGVCKCNEASCTCEKCKAVREKQPAAPGAPAAKPAASASLPVSCDKDDDDDDDDDKDAVCSEPETCPDKSPCCPGDKGTPSKETVNVDNHCGKCDKKDGDKPETCPEKSPCCPKEDPAK